MRPWQGNSTSLSLRFLIYKRCGRVTVWDNGINTCKLLTSSLGSGTEGLPTAISCGYVSEQSGREKLLPPSPPPLECHRPEAGGDSSRLRATGRCPEIHARSWIWWVGTTSDKFPFRSVHRTCDLLTTFTRRWSHSAPNMHRWIRIHHAVCPQKHPPFCARHPYQAMASLPPPQSLLGNTLQLSVSHYEIYYMQI